MNYIIVVSLLLFLAPIIQADTDSLDLDKGAYYNYREWKCKIRGNKAIIEGRAKLTILNKMGDRYNHIGFREDKYKKLRDVKIRVIDSEGSVISKIAKKKLNKQCGFGSSYGLYDDNCYYWTEPTLPKYPYSIEYEYTKELSSLFFWRGVIFQQSIPVETSSYTLTCQENFEFQYKLYGTDSVLNKTTSNGKDIYQWEFQNIEAYDDIDYSMEGDPEPVSLEFVANKFKLESYSFSGPDWNSIGQWYKDLSEECYFTQPIGYVKEIIPDKLAAAEEIYYHMLNEYRYVLVSIGIGGWKPHQAEDIVKKNYGDCKDLTTVLISELRLNEIEAYPCLALTRGDGKLDVDFPNFGFNHVFAMAIIDNDTIWMDPTCTYCTFGNLPGGDNNIPVLVMTDSSSFIINTPNTNPADCRSIMKSKVFFGKKGNATIESSKNYYGNFAWSKRKRLLHLDKDETETEIYRLFPGGRKKYELIDYDIQDLEDRKKPVTINLKANSKRKIDLINRTYFIQPNIMVYENVFDFVDTVDREVPIYLGIPDQREHYIEIIPDSSIRIDSILIPPNDSIMYDFGEVHCYYEKLEDRIIIKTTKKYNHYSIPKSEFSNFEQFRKESRKLLLNSIKIFAN